jgi:glycosyltransferase involved in cell wall biosynthesis
VNARRLDAPLRIGLNLIWLVPDSGGAGRYVAELIPELLRAEPGTRVVAYVARRVPQKLLDADWASEIEWERYDVEGVGPPWHFAHQFGTIPWNAARRGLDVLHGPAYFVAPVAPRLTTVVTVLDLIWLHHPESVPPKARVVMPHLAPLCARRADRILTISEAAKEDIAAEWDMPAAEIDVTPLGIRLGDAPREALGAAGVRERFGLRPGPVVLCVAQKRTHKNLDGLIRALALLDDPAAQLVLPGAPTPYEDRLRELAAQLGVADRVRFPAWVEDDELEGLYQLADCFVLPSFEEGFGLPVLEAMARGVPVACSGVSSLPEVAGDAALLFDPADPSDIASSIDRLLGDAGLRAQLVQRGLVRCREFTWERTARETLASYRRAIAARAAR